jgi:hypothetical protein
MKETEKTETEDARSGKKGNRWLVNGSISKEWPIQNHLQIRDNIRTHKRWEISLAHPQTAGHSSQKSSAQHCRHRLRARWQHPEKCYFKLKSVNDQQWLLSPKEFSRKKCLSCLKLNDRWLHPRRPSLEEIMEPLDKRVSFIGKGGWKTMCHMVNNPRRYQIERTRHYKKHWFGLSLELRKIYQFQTNFGGKDIYSETRGHVLTPFFWKKTGQEG